MSRFVFLDRDGTLVRDMGYTHRIEDYELLRISIISGSAQEDAQNLLSAQRYQSEFMAALSRRATRRRHVNVLQHCIGHFRKRLEDESRAELAALIDDDRGELVPLIVPITMIRHHVRRLRVEYLAGQVYLEPHPKELMLHV